MEYKVVTKLLRVHGDSAVQDCLPFNDVLADGWKPHGSPAISMIPSSSSTWSAENSNDQRSGTETIVDAWVMIVQAFIKPDYNVQIHDQVIEAGTRSLTEEINRRFYSALGIPADIIGATQSPTTVEVRAAQERFNRAMATSRAASDVIGISQVGEGEET